MAKINWQLRYETLKEKVSRIAQDWRLDWSCFDGRTLAKQIAQAIDETEAGDG